MYRSSSRRKNKSESKGHVKKSSFLRSLDPILINDLLHVGGRLNLASTTFGAEYQVVLLENDHVTSLVIEHYHLLSGHSGRDFVQSLAREKFFDHDNGTNFTGGERELRESINAWNHNKIHEALLQKNIRWIFNPLPPYMGQIRETFGKAVFTRSKRRILCRDAGRDKCNILAIFFGNDGLENIFPCSRADKNGHRLAKSSRWRYCPYQRRKFTSQQVASL